MNTLLSAALEQVSASRDAMESTLRDLVEISSWTNDKPGVDEAGRRLCDAMMLPVERFASERYGDHLAFHAPRRASENGVVLIGHIDTVFPKHVFAGYRREGDRAYGPGVLDMKGGLVVIAFALRALERVGALAKIPLSVMVVTDEEVGSPDSTPHLRRIASGARAALDFESGRPHDEIVTCRKGTGSFVAHARGRAAHAGNAHAQGANAIWALSRWIDAAQRLTDYARGVTVNIGTVRGGMGKNTVPETAEADGDLRFATHADETALREALVAACATSVLPGTHLEIAWGAGRPPMERSESSAALRARFAAAQRDEALGDGEMDLVGGGSDAATTSAMGIPSIDALGPRGEGFHTLGEYIEIPTLEAKARALVRFLVTEFGLGSA
jgi:glutamate carboxypeptidase